MPILRLTIFLMLFFLSPAQAVGNADAGWEGVWFTCEFAQRQRAPDEGCQMFDDEGFSYQNGQLDYLRMLNSQETSCRGNKKGQCFARDENNIKVSKRKIGKARIEGQRLIVRYLGCEQAYRLTDGTDYMTVVPENKACFWSRERHFYIAPFEGQVQIEK